MKMKILCDPAPPGGGGGAPPITPPQPWYSSLPDDLKSNALITSLKGPEDLAKGYVNAQGLIGQKRLVAPQPNWTEADYNSFYKEVGRPEAADKYSPASVKLAEGIPVSKESITKTYETFHKAGLTDAQAKTIMDYYNTGVNEQFTGATRAADTARAAATESLKQEWGDKFDANVDIAKAVVRKFGTPESVAELEAGLGNNPAIIKMFHNLGKGMLEDHARSSNGSSNGLEVGSAAQAMQKINELKADPNFTTALNTKNHPGHDNAVKLWNDTFRQAYPGKQT